MKATERTYTLVFGRPVYIGEKPVNIESYTKKTANGANGFEVKDLHMEFDIKKDNSKEPNKGYITVYNLSDETVNYLDANQRENLAVMLHAGYNGDEKLVFSGTVEFVEDKFDDETRQTKLILGDGTLNLFSAQTSRSYRKGTKLDTVMNDLISDLKLPKGRVISFGDATLQHSMAFTGTASQNLANLARNTNSNFSVQDGAVYWTREGSRFANTMFEISEEGGMIGSPSPKNPEKGKKAKAKKTVKKPTAASSDDKKAKPQEDVGMTVTTVLNGAILPESTVYLNSKRYKGFYKVINVKHKGGYEGGEWTTELGLAETRGVMMK